MTKPRSIPASEWDLHKAQICTLYEEEKKTLKELVELMEENHGFHATSVMTSPRVCYYRPRLTPTNSPSQYTRQFRKWGLKKNATREAWELASLQVKKRELEGKDTEIRMNNRPVPAKKLKKAILRYADQTSQASQDLGKLSPLRTSYSDFHAHSSRQRCSGERTRHCHRSNSVSSPACGN